MEQVEKMNRNNFLKNLGFKGTALLAVYCAGSSLTSCVNDGQAVAPQVQGDLTVDLSVASNKALNTVGGYVVVSQTVIARTGATTFAAVTQVCSHEGQTQVSYVNGEFYCSAHGARFSTSGKGLNSNGSRGIASYQTQLNGTILTVART
jgi:cytochrome b6-f complex iron-sulfur subunit